MGLDTLRLIIRQKLAQGDLPHNSIPRFWGGPANNEACDACEETIGSGQLIIEAIIWDTERDEPTRRRPSVP
jgi:hypothetical protein